MKEHDYTEDYIINDDDRKLLIAIKNCAEWLYYSSLNSSTEEDNAVRQANCDFAGFIWSAISLIDVHAKDGIEFRKARRNNNTKQTTNELPTNN